MIRWIIRKNMCELIHTQSNLKTKLLWHCELSCCLQSWHSASEHWSWLLCLQLGFLLVLTLTGRQQQDMDGAHHHLPPPWKSGVGLLKFPKSKTQLKRDWRHTYKMEIHKPTGRKPRALWHCYEQKVWGWELKKATKAKIDGITSTKIAIDWRK